MSGIAVALHTPTERFSNEFLDVIKLFFSVEHFAVNPESDGDAEIIIHEYGESNGEAHCLFTFRGVSRSKSAALPQGEDAEHDALIKKRAVKRLCKVTLYELLKELTGHRPPWGSLTGIRPTRLMYEKLAVGMNADEAAAALQAEFDVTPEKTDLLERIISEQAKLPKPDEHELDVYVSVPFCRTRCAYCSFPGEALGKGGMVEPYLDALIWELHEGARLMREAGYRLRLRAVYVGGGTPTSLDEKNFARLMESVMEVFPNAVEYTVEAGRPDTITRAKLEMLRRLGVGRISVNPQTMNDETLRIIGRDHTSAQTIEAFRMARELGFEDINMDVIAGLPGEGEEHFSRTMDAIAALKPDSLTVHTLAIKRSSRLNIEKAPLPDAHIAADMVRMGEETAALLGLKPYYLYRQKYMAGQQQNVGYAREGAACLYNVDIMEETTSILAMGAGAISKRIFPDRELRIERAPNVSDVSVYISRVNDMARRKEILFKSTEGGIKA